MSHSSQTDDFRDLLEFSPEDFQACLNEHFTVDLNHVGLSIDGSPKPSDAYQGANSAVVKLVDVTPRKRAAPGCRENPFSLLFVGSHEQLFFCDVHGVACD